MINAPIVPNRKVVDILPAMTDLQVMVINHEPHEPFVEGIRLEFGEAIDPLYVVAESEDALPACDWVGADYGVDCFEYCDERGQSVWVLG